MKTATGTTLIRNGQIVDGTGAAPLPNGAVVIEDGQITFVGREENAPLLSREATTIDARGGTIMPGLDSLTVLKCATKTGAEILGRADEFGTVEVGKLADLLVVEGDVVKNIALLSDRSKFLAVLQAGVIKAGRLA